MPGMDPELVRPRVFAHDPPRSPAGGMTIYDLLRHFCESSRWASYDEQRDAEALIDRLEQLGFFGNLADTMRSTQRGQNV